jgi:hypothetical protein
VAVGGGGGVFVWLLSGMTYIPDTHVHLTLNYMGESNSLDDGKLSGTERRIGECIQHVLKHLYSDSYKIQQSILGLEIKI